MAELEGASLTEIVRGAQRQGPEKSGPNPYRQFGSTELKDAYNRMFSSRVGSEAVAIVGNEAKTLNILEAIGTDILLEMLELQGFFRGRPGKMHARESENDLRAVIVPPSYDAPAALVILDPQRSVEDTEAITPKVPLDLKALDGVISTTRRYFEREPSDASRVQDLLFSMGVSGLKEALWIIQPDIVISRRPKMVPLCAPWPCLDVTSPTQMSTAGIFCRNAAGELGVTACFHGTGPVGTQVQVGLQQATVTIADNIQDTVFVPLSDGHNLPQMRGHRGVLRDRAPGLQDQVEFYGASSGATPTQIESYDAGILRFRRTVQLRVQTGADTNTGDSGSALINQDDKVIGFAFERAAIGDKPQITDWIWAANALSALGLMPV